MEKVSYGGWPNCIKLSNGQTELIATTDVGPRIMRFGYAGGQNLLKEYKDQMSKTGGDTWTETFTNADMLEFETLGPLVKIPADGGKVEYVERWALFKVKVGEDESEIDKKVLPLVKKTIKAGI